MSEPSKSAPPVPFRPERDGETRYDGVLLCAACDHRETLHDDEGCCVRLCGCCAFEPGDELSPGGNWRRIIPPARDGETLSDERRIDELLREFQMACEDAAEFDADSIRASAKHRAILRNELRSELLAVAALRAELAEATVERRAADYIAGACSRYVHQGWLGARSEIGDALLDYASTRYGDSNPIGGVDATYQKLRAARSASGKDRNDS